MNSPKKVSNLKKNRNRRRAILVLGMHRSGTSALTRVISLMGARLPSDLWTPISEVNERGFWESVELNRIQDHFLHEIGLSWNDPRPLPEGWVDFDQTKTFRDELRRFLDAMTPDSPLIVLKDPRICRLAPAWISTLSDCSYETLAVIPIRNPIEVALSLDRRDRFCPQHAHLLWLRHTLEAESATRTIRRSFVTFDDLLQSWRATIGKVAKDLKIRWPIRYDDSGPEIESFLDSSLRHHVIPNDDLMHRTDLIDWLPQTYYAFLSLCLDPNDQPSISTLNTISSHLRKTDQLFESVLTLPHGESKLATNPHDLESKDAFSVRRYVLDSSNDPQSENIPVTPSSDSRGVVGTNVNDKIIFAVQFYNLLSQNNILSGEKTNLTDKVNELTAHFLSLVQKNEKLSNLVKERENDNIILIDKIAHQSEKIEVLSERLNEIETSLATRDNVLKGLFENISEVKDISTRLSQKIQVDNEKVYSEFNSLNESIRSGQPQFDQLFEQVAELRAQIDNKTTSTISSVLDTAVKAIIPTNIQLIFRYLSDRKIIQRSGLFDEKYYRASNPTYRGRPSAALRHFIKIGGAEGYSPHLLFDSSFYLMHYPDVAEKRMNPLVHFLRFGVHEQRNPHPLFSTKYYLANNPDVEKADVNPLRHFLLHGGIEGRRPCDLFHSEFYLQRYPDVTAAHLNPLMHYLTYGSIERRDPSPTFSTDYYLKENPDVAESGVNPLVHFVTNGRHEGRSSCPKSNANSWTDDRIRPNQIREQGITSKSSGSQLLDAYLTSTADDDTAVRDIGQSRLFDKDFYLRENSDVVAAKADALRHYCTSGWREGRNPNHWFKGNAYLERYRDEIPPNLNPLHHYVRCRDPETRVTESLENELIRNSIFFDTDFYSQISGCGVHHQNDPVEHYISTGLLRGYSPSRLVATERVRGLKRRPHFAIILPTYNSSGQHLKAALESIKNQTYPDWQLFVCDDGSERKECIDILDNYSSINDRIHVHYSKRNQGISTATNKALEMSEGDYAVFMDHDDLLLPTALEEVALYYNRSPETDVFYSDQDYIDEDGNFQGHFFKPDWSPWMFRSVMYVGHLLIVRRQLALAMKGFDSKFDYVQDFDFMLRVSEKTSNIVHIPRILYRWRKTDTSVAGGGKSQIDFGRLQEQAVNAHLVRLNIRAHAVRNPDFPHRLIIDPAGQPNDSESSPLDPKLPRVRMFLTADQDSNCSLRRPSERLLTHTEYPNLEFCALPTADSDSVELINDLVSKCECEYWMITSQHLLFDSPDWLKRLVRYMAISELGCVSPLIINPVGRVARAGVVIGGPLKLGFAMKDWQVNDNDGYAGSLSCLREVSALTGDCVLLSRAALEERHGLRDELGLYFGVIDYAMRCRFIFGETNLLTPHIVVQSYLSELPEPDRRGIPFFLWSHIWQNVIDIGDPYYNRNLDVARADYSIPSRVLEDNRN